MRLLRLTTAIVVLLLVSSSAYGAAATYMAGIDGRPVVRRDGLLDPVSAGLPAFARELPELRTEKAATFVLPSGQFAAVSVGAPLFTRDDGGRWVPVDGRGKKIGDTFVFDLLPGGERVAFDLTRPAYLLSRDGVNVVVRFPGDARGVIENDHTVSYRLSDAATLRWTVDGDIVRKDIVVTAPGRVEGLNFTIRASGGVHQELAENRIRMLRGDTVVFITEAPFLTDVGRRPLAPPVTIAGANGNYAYDYDPAGLPLPYIIDPSSGPNSPATVTDDGSYGSKTWTNPGNAAASDNAIATATHSNLAPTASTHYLNAVDFGFSIPSDMTIDGVVVEIERKCSHNSAPNDCTDDTVKLVKGGTVQGNNNGDTSTLWPTSYAYATYGSASDLWGLTLAPSDINASNFGAVLSAIIHTPIP